MIDNEFFKEEVLNWMSIRDSQMVQVDLLPGLHYYYAKELGRSFDNYMRDSIIHRINAKVLGKDLPSFTETRTEVFNSPKNPWQFFKDMYADKWFMRSIVKKWPVKFVKQKITLTATWDQWAVYPWLDKIPVSPRWQPVRIVLPAKVDVTKELFNEFDKPDGRIKEE